VNEFVDTDTLIAASVTDGGANFKNAANMLGTVLKFSLFGFPFFYFLLVGGEHFSCVAHLLNLCIHHSIKDSKISPLLTQVSNIYIFRETDIYTESMSSLKRQLLNSVQRQLCLRSCAHS
jgi:hypothetical protein